MDQPIIKPVSSKTITYELQADYSYLWFRGSTECKLTAKKGFTFDGASIPRFIWGFPLMLSPAHPKILAAATIHDLCYSSDGEVNSFEFGRYEERMVGKPDFLKSDRYISKKEADTIFLDINKKAGMDKTRRQLTYLAVKYFGKY